MKQISRDDLSRLAEIIREETGNQILEKNFPMVEARMRSYLEKLGVSGMPDYWSRFALNERQEREQLTGLMTTHYTFFFREFLHFEVLKSWLEKNSLRLQKRFHESGEGLRVWSAACSRGQEVYSLAMFLLTEWTEKYKVPVQVLGTDIDPESVAYGKNGVYPIKEVNTIPIQYLSRFWKKGTGPVKEFAAAHPDLRKVVSFQPVNLLQISNEIPRESFDVIFVRNVFIYFPENLTRSTALALESRLRPGGLFVSGLSEPLRFPEWKLESVASSAYLKPLPPSERHHVSSAMTPIASANPAKFRALVVDDSPTIQKLMTMILKKDQQCGEIIVAADGREARELLNREKFDVVTLDIHMPGVGGIEFLEKLYRPSEDPPVIMVSSVNRTDQDLALKALTLGAFDYVEKPAMNQIEKSTSEIHMKVKAAIDRSRSMTRQKFEETSKASAASESSALSFDREIAKQIVIPDASRCLRLIVSDSKAARDVEEILKAQSNEHRSPPSLVICESQEVATSLAESLGPRLHRSCQVVGPAESRSLRPNRFYFAGPGILAQWQSSELLSQVSIQILQWPVPELSAFARLPGQVLLSESLYSLRGVAESQLKRRVSDITPPSSFSSLSAEYFAMIREAA